VFIVKTTSRPLGGNLIDWMLVASDILSSRDISHVLWVAFASMTTLKTF